MNHQARKRFGQNFLQAPNIISDILSYIQLDDDQHWVEIGPGMGALTEPLLHSNVRLDVIELDRDLVEHLISKFRSNPKLTIHSADALKFDFPSLAKNQEKLRIIGNLPYNISTPLLFHLLESATYIEDMYFMLQKEVVERICATPGSKKYGRLSVMMQYYCETEMLFEVPPECFRPAPKVMSAVVRLEPYSKPPVVVDDVASLQQLVTQAFSQRRKTIRNSLSHWIDDQQWSVLDINAGLRAESLTLEQFAQLSNLLHQNQT